MSRIVPWIAAAFALFGLVLLPVAAFIGVSPMSDEVLDGSQNSLIVATILFLGYVVVALGKEFAAYQRPTE